MFFIMTYGSACLRQLFPRAATMASSRSLAVFSRLNASLLRDVHSAEQPVYRFAAYNVGWNYNDKKRSAEWLSDEIVKVWQEHSFHAIGISEIFEVDYPEDQPEAVLQTLVEALEMRTAMSWKGRQDGHCFYIWQPGSQCDLRSLHFCGRPITTLAEASVLLRSASGLQVASTRLPWPHAFAWEEEEKRRESGQTVPRQCSPTGCENCCSTYEAEACGTTKG